MTPLTTRPLVYDGSVPVQGELMAIHFFTFYLFLQEFGDDSEFHGIF